MRVSGQGLCLGCWLLAFALPGVGADVVHYYVGEIHDLPFLIPPETPAFDITVAKGWWNFDKWGLPYDPAPDGVHVVTPKPSPQLTSLLGYITGTSLSLINKESSFTEVDNGMYHGMHPREAFCAENLSPLTKLLPYRRLPMDTLTYFNSQYHSFKISRPPPESGNNMIVLSLTMVTEENITEFKPEAREFRYVRKEGGDMRRTSLRVDRSILGSGQIEGRLLIELKNLDYEKTVKIATYTDVTPWYMRAFGHTMVTNQLDNEKALQHVRFIPAMQHGRPNMIVVKDLEIPPRQLYQIEIYFEKVFLHVSDFPPDADHPLEVFAGWAVLADTNDTVWGNGLLVDMPKPDFSMPFNVITLTSTVLAFLFGSIFNALVRKKKRRKKKGAQEGGRCMRCTRCCKKKETTQPDKAEDEEPGTEKKKEKVE